MNRNNIMKTIIGTDEKGLDNVKLSWNTFINDMKNDSEERKRLIFIAIIVCLATLQAVNIVRDTQYRIQKCDLLIINTIDNQNIESFNGIEVNSLNKLLNNNKTKQLISNDPNFKLNWKNCRWIWQK